MNFFEKKEKQVELQKKMYVVDTKLNLFLFISISYWCQLAACLCYTLWLFQAVGTHLFIFSVFIVVNFILSKSE